MLGPRQQIQLANNNKIILFSNFSDSNDWSTNSFESAKIRKNRFGPNYISYGVITWAIITNSNHCYKSRALFKRSSMYNVHPVWWSDQTVKFEFTNHSSQGKYESSVLVRVKLYWTEGSYESCLITAFVSRILRDYFYWLLSKPRLKIYFSIKRHYSGSIENGKKTVPKWHEKLPIDSHILYDLSVLTLVSWPIWLTSAKYEAWVFEHRIPVSDS